MSSQQNSNNVIAFSGNTMLYESVKRFALKGLNDLIRVLMENIDDALFELSEKVGSDRERNMYFDAMRQIRLQRQSIEEAFDAGMNQRFADFLARRAAGEKRQQAEPTLDEMKLVDQDTMEGKLAIDNMISKARPQFEDDLFAVAERLRTILQRKSIDEDVNPLDPKAICECFHLACEDKDLEIHVQLIFYKMFDRFVLSQLSGFYREMNDYFVKKGVLPEFEASKERMKHSTKFMAKRIAEHETEAPPSEQQAVDSTPAGAPTGQPAEGGLLGMLQQALGQAAVTSTGVITGQHPVVTSDGSGQSVAGASGGSITGGVNQASVVALAGLQHAVLQQASPAISTDPSVQKTEMNQQLLQFKQEHAADIDQDSTQLIDIVTMLFDIFFDDDALPDPIKVLIGRLQIPILKVAMIDSGFFNKKKHPARQFLDTLSQAALGWSKEPQREIRLVEKIEQLVEFLLTEFDQDIAVFTQACQELEAFLEQENAKADAELEEIQQQEQDREQQIEKAQQTAYAFIQKMLGKGDFEFPVIDFLEGVWRTVLINTLLSTSEDSRHWHNLKRITTTLIWSLIPKKSEKQRLKLLKALPALLRALSRAMELNQVNQTVCDEVFQMLVIQHAQVVKETSKNLAERRARKSAAAESQHEQLPDVMLDANDEGQALDFEFTDADSGDIVVQPDKLDVEAQTESIETITAASLPEVVSDLDSFSQEVKDGEVQISEDIVIYGDAVMQQAKDFARDGLDEQARELNIGDWITFKSAGSKPVNAKLSWKSNVTGKYIFVDRHGAKTREMTVTDLIAEFRNGNAQMMKSISVFDRAINSLSKAVQ
ncbi:MAG: DUF1631 family protein [Gammaproteobacteria bacterium]|nr:DUF1631 family protein [Gammaproteobacteria bacterium]